MTAEPQLAGCEGYGNVLIHHGARNIVRRHVINCPTCERRTPAVLQWDGAWYGQTVYCAVCLDGWVDGWRMDRPFARYWKRDRGAHIKALWDDAMLPERYRAWTHWDIHRATCDAWESGCAECETRPS